jgi:hypothetical protein
MGRRKFEPDWHCSRGARNAQSEIGNRKSEMKMGLTGLEPVTLRLSSACSNQLSYRPHCGYPAELFPWRALSAIT